LDTSSKIGTCPLKIKLNTEIKLEIFGGLTPNI